MNAAGRGAGPAWVGSFFRAIELLVALMLAVMVVLVFANVVLRYGFNSGLTVSEEVSRWLFIWITFLGAVVALHEHRHLGVDIVVQRLSPRGKKACLVLTHAVMLYITWLLFQGALAQARINWDVAAPSTGAPMAIIYAPALIFAVLAAAVLLADLWRLLSGRLADEELVMVQESEEAEQLKHILATPEAPGAPVPRESRS